jgi:hypothetical protein
LRVVDYDLPVAASSRILIFTRLTPAALAVLRKLGLRLPKQPIRATGSLPSTRSTPAIGLPEG